MNMFRKIVTICLVAFLYSEFFTFLYPKVANI